MSGLGLLATAFAGGAKVVGEQAGGDIEQSRKAELMKQQADIEEQMRMRLSEFGEKQRRDGVIYDATGAGGEAKLAARGKELEQSSGAAISQARGMIPVAVESVKAVGGAQTDEAIRSATAMLPLEVKKAYAVADAAGRASAAHRQSPGAELQAKLKIVEDALGRKMTETEKLGLLGLAKARDPELDTEIIKTVDPVTGAETTRKQVRRPGAGGADGGASLADQARAAVAAGADINKVNERLKAAGQPPLSAQGGGNTEAAATSARTRKDPISGQPLNEREWDKKYGRGDFKKDATDGLPSMRPF